MKMREKYQGKNKQTKKETSKPTRKQLRKVKRLQKKAKKNEYFQNKNKKHSNEKGKSLCNNILTPLDKRTKTQRKILSKNDQSGSPSIPNPQIPENILIHQQKEREEKVKIRTNFENQINKQRKKQLTEANKDEDKVIKKLEKQLKLNKRKSKTIPKSFLDDGLDYLLELCDSEKIQKVAKTDSNLVESGSDFEDDIAIITGKKDIGLKSQKEKNIPQNIEEEDESQFEESEEELDNGSDFDVESNDGVSEDQDDKNPKNVKSRLVLMEENNSEKFSDSEADSESWDEEFDDQSDDDLDNKRRKRTCSNSSSINVVKKQKVQGTLNDKINQERDDGFWEDIYGRTRDKEGNVVQANVGKYIPPHLRLGLDSDRRSKELSRLHKQLKGLINRLAENNMHSISSQIDELYMKNSRNDMNETLTTLIFESLILPTLSSERLVAEHVMLMAILHANIGMEVGAHFLQTTVKKFDELFNENCTVQDKSLDNTVLILSHLYNFKVFNAILMYNILDKLSEKFTEKEVELILLILKNVGLSLRKDDPAALKYVILRLQKKANESIELRNNTRVRFMLDILLAVKNNNMAKIPQYDPSYSEHLKKLIKTMIHKGKYLTELKITLDDLLKVEERGRWWIVGSAWTGNTNLPQEKEISHKSDKFSSQILELASKQRMNTDTRRNVFCILMTAEDYMDAFEKLLRLGLKAGQEQEIIHVLIHCLLQEKVFNPYYAHLANQFCTTDRKYQLTIQYNMWDRFKELSDLSTSQITNMAKFLAHLFLEKSLPISVLKVIQFADMDKQCVKLMRQLLLALLFHHCEETMMAVFARVSKPTKLKMFRESILLFLHHFVLRNVKDNSDEAFKLRERVKLVETALTSVDTNKIL